MAVFFFRVSHGNGETLVITAGTLANAAWSMHGTVTPLRDTWHAETVFPLESVLAKEAPAEDEDDVMVSLRESGPWLLGWTMLRSRAATTRQI